MWRTKFEVSLCAVVIILLPGGCGFGDAAAGKTITITGTTENREVSLYDLDFPQQAAEQGIGCTGYRSSPINEGKPIALLNEKGEPVATGTFLSGRWQVDGGGSPKTGCVFPWKISNAPAGLREYRVGVLGYPMNGPYTETQVLQPIQLVWYAIS